jgi:hypothetical protein
MVKPFQQKDLSICRPITIAKNTMLLYFNNSLIIMFLQNDSIYLRIHVVSQSKRTTLTYYTQSYKNLEDCSVAFRYVTIRYGIISYYPL